MGAAVDALRTERATLVARRNRATADIASFQSLASAQQAEVANIDIKIADIDAVILLAGG